MYILDIFLAIILFYTRKRSQIFIIIAAMFLAQALNNIKNISLSPLNQIALYFNPRPAGPLDFPRPAGGGGFEHPPPPPSISAPAHRRTKRKTAFESSRKIISKSFRSFFGSGQN